MLCSEVIFGKSLSENLSCSASLPAGTGDESVLNVAQMPVLSNKECNKYFRGRVKENEMCTKAFQGGVGACEVRDEDIIDHDIIDALTKHSLALIATCSL